MKRFTDGVFKVPEEYLEASRVDALDRIDGVWVINTAKMAEYNNNQVYTKMDLVYKKIIRNEVRPSYKTDPEHDKYKAKYEAELQALDAQLKEI